MIPDLIAACAVVRDNPSIWPFRSFPYGPLGLEVRKASPADAAKLRNFHLGVAAGACQIPRSEITAAFFCGPECPKNRRDHMVRQLPLVRSAVSSFQRLARVQLLSIWAPKGDLRVNDVFVLNGQVREAIPSAKLGLVPSGNWKPWTSLKAYLATLQVSEGEINQLVDQMLAAGVSALVLEPSQVRVVGVGIADNESGLLFLRAGGSAPRVGSVRSDGDEYTIVEEVAPGVWFYETS